VDKGLHQSLTKKNIMLGFKVIGIWQFNPKAMNVKIRSANVYITIYSNHEVEGEGHYTLDDKVGPSQQE
jgi:hypothetical protein